MARARLPAAVATEKAWCPYCGAQAGERCKKKDGTPSGWYPHALRSRLALKRGYLPVSSGPG